MSHRAYIYRARCVLALIKFFRFCVGGFKVQRTVLFVVNNYTV